MLERRPRSSARERRRSAPDRPAPARSWAPSSARSTRSRCPGARTPERRDSRARRRARAPCSRPVSRKRCGGTSPEKPSSHALSPSERVPGSKGVARPGGDHRVVVDQLPPNGQRHPGVRARAARDPQIGMEPERDRERSASPVGVSVTVISIEALRQQCLVLEPVGEREQPERLVRRVPLEPCPQAGAVLIGGRLDHVPLA